MATDRGGSHRKSKGDVSMILSRADITEALEDRLAASAEAFDFSLGVAWPNLNSDGTVPYLDVSHPSARREGGGLRGTAQDTAASVREVGIFQITVATAEGSGVAEGEALADKVAGLFPMGLRIDTPSSIVAITAPPNILGGFETDIEWRTPVQISYSAISK